MRKRSLLSTYNSERHLKSDLEKAILIEVRTSRLLSVKDTCRADKKVAVNTMFIERHTPHNKYRVYGRVYRYNRHHLNVPDINCVNKETETLV